MSTYENEVAATGEHNLFWINRLKPLQAGPTSLFTALMVQFFKNPAFW